MDPDQDVSPDTEDPEAAGLYTVWAEKSSLSIIEMIVTLLSIILMNWTMQVLGVWKDMLLLDLQDQDHIFFQIVYQIEFWPLETVETSSVLTVSKSCNFMYYTWRYFKIYCCS